ncbi:MAG TPA: hypoxanthine phosphoribosyltransferase [Candidatus Cloacimonadota bacterium]|nr:hypoxanthine phosphoribosyltransferase [Candidatus Cloacimonadota bacterium]HOQ80951.1 hypoxanthine phosphoribosyltransferase [Candidatus Cloacimonadota bacterium]HPK40318.1 hypoxanthine phosphoribosyltransferase [Candidatus Cloacimonadota bacterium]
MNQDLSAILFDENTIRNRIFDIGAQLSIEYKDKCPVLICILKGASLFLCDLMRAMTIPLEIDFMSISSYGSGTKSTGVVQIRKDIDTDIHGRHVIIVEDIVDSGLSLNYIIDYLKNHNPASIKTCVLLNKPEAHKIDVQVDYVGFDVGNEFAIGYGLDYAEKYRNLPFIGILKEEVYS